MRKCDFLKEYSKYWLERVNFYTMFYHVQNFHYKELTVLQTENVQCPGILYYKTQKTRHAMYHNVTVRRIRATTVTVEKQ
jgi:hypothetical protein